MKTDMVGLKEHLAKAGNGALHNDKNADDEENVKSSADDDDAEELELEALKH
jgi:hypothetical protein